ncbi:MAG: hypothetical protein FWG47_05725 [Propionibacteriaceae bacterium]|nr:hypothetical protein [Propionibacteriaceae bacterium]
MKRLPLILIAGVAALTLTACAPTLEPSPPAAPAPTESQTADPMPTETPSLPAQPEPTEDPTPPSAPGSASDYTPPGTTLQFGATGTFPWAPIGGDLTAVQITPLEVVTGSQADFEVFDEKTRAQLSNMTPYYLMIEAKADPSLAYVSISSSYIKLFDQDGDRISPMIIFGGGLDSCKEENVPKDGSTFKTCIPFYGTSAQTPAGARWDADYDEGKYSSFGGNPVDWKI